MKRLLTILSLVCVFSLSFFLTNAQEPGDSVVDVDITTFGDEAVDAPEVSSSPIVYLSSLKLDKAEYSSGEAVKVSLLSQNQSDRYLGALYYRISLVDTIDEGAVEVYDTQIVGPKSIDSKSNSYFELEYSLPKYIPLKSMEIRVEVMMEDETLLGDSTVPITFSEIRGSFVDIDKAYLTVGGEKFHVEEGPMVDSAGKKPVLSIVASSINTVTVKPYIVVYSKDSILSPVISKDGQDSVIGPTSKTINIDLPVDKIPGTYIAYVNLRNASTLDGSSQIVSVRYIVGGEQGKILNIDIDKQNVIKGDSIEVSVAYGGSPFDITTGTYPVQGEAELSIKLFNESGAVIGEQTKKVSLDNVGSEIFTIESNKDADAIKVEAKLVKDGVVLDEYLDELSSVGGNSGSKLGMGLSDKNILLIIAGVILVLMVIIISGLMWKKGNIPAAILLIGVSVSVSIFGFDSYTATAWRGDVPTTPGRFANVTVRAAPSVVDSAPIELVPGQEFKIRTTVKWTMCNNMTFSPYQAIKMHALDETKESNYYRGAALTLPTKTRTGAFVNRTASKVCNHGQTVEAHGDDKVEYYQFSYGCAVTWKAPTTPGRYIITTNGGTGDVYNNGELKNYSGARAHLYMVVVSDDAPVIPGTPDDSGDDDDDTTLSCTDRWVQTGWENACRQIDPVTGVGKQFATWSLDAPGAYNCPTHPDSESDHESIWRPCRLNADGEVEELCEFYDPDTLECLPPIISKFEGKPDPASKAEGCELKWKVENSSECKIDRLYKYENAEGDFVTDRTNDYVSNFDPRILDEYQAKPLDHSAQFIMTCTNGDLETKRTAQCRLQGGAEF